MPIDALADLFSDLLGMTVYRLQFPQNQRGRAVKVEATSGIVEKGGIKDFNIQFMTKAEHPSESEQLALSLIEKLHKVTDMEFGLGTYQLVLCYCQSPTPSFVGELSNGEYIYSINFRLLVANLND